MTGADMNGHLEIKKANRRSAQNAKAPIGTRPERAINERNLPPFGGVCYNKGAWIANQAATLANTKRL